jgi:hypothetical protein
MMRNIVENMRSNCPLNQSFSPYTITNGDTHTKVKHVDIFLFQRKDDSQKRKWTEQLISNSNKLELIQGQFEKRNLVEK